MTVIAIFMLVTANLEILKQVSSIQYVAQFIKSKV